MAQLRAFHRPRLAELAAAEPDLFAVETIPCRAEVEAICAELAGLGVPGLGVAVGDRVDHGGR